MSARGIGDYLDALERAGIEMHSLMVLRHGEVVAQGWWAPYSPERRHLVYSLSKSFTSMAAGIAWGEGAFDLEDSVAELLGDLLPEDVDERFRRLRVRHVLSMATGHEHDTIDLGWRRAIAAAAPGGAGQNTGLDLVRAFFTIAPEREPGTLFAYNQLATHTVARIVERHAGTRLLDYLRPRLFEPLSIPEPAWLGVNGHDFGYSGLHTHTQAVAKLGQLLLQGGRWEGAQLVPAEWIAQAIRLQQRNDPPEFTADPELGGTPDWRLGYGFQFWIGQHGVRGDGAYGQFCLVWPQEDVVVATTACTSQMGLQLELAYRHLLPAVRGEGGVEAAADAELVERLSVLAVPLPRDTGAGVAGAFEREPGEVGHGVAPALTRVELTPRDTGWDARLTIGDVVGELPIGRGQWLEGAWPVAGVPFVCAGGCLADGGFEAHLRMIETPHHLVLVADRGAGTFTVRWNEPPLHGSDPAAHSLT